MLEAFDIHKKIKLLPKPNIPMVDGYRIDARHVLHIVCDMNISSEKRYLNFQQIKKLI